VEELIAIYLNETCCIITCLLFAYRLGGKQSKSSVVITGLETKITFRYPRRCKVYLGKGLLLEQRRIVRFEVFTAMTMKKGVFWDVTP
jgi:hypothetical protein